MARRKVEAGSAEPKLVEYADEEPSAFASMLGGLIEVNVVGRDEKKRDFESLVARVGIFVTDIYEGVGRGVARKLLTGKLKIDGLLPNVMTLNTVTRIFSVQ